MPWLMHRNEQAAREYLKKMGFGFARKYEEADIIRWWILRPNLHGMNSLLENDMFGQTAYLYLSDRDYHVTGKATTRTVKLRSDMFFSLDMPEESQNATDTQVS